MAKPSKKQRKAARAVLLYYRKQANALADKTDQEQPSEWAQAIEVCCALLKDDPSEIFSDYAKDYDAGH